MEERLLSILKVPMSRNQMRKLGINPDRAALRSLERKGKITKSEAYAHNSLKKGLDNKVIAGTRYYIYKAV